MTVYIVQYRPFWLEQEANYQKLHKMLSEAEIRPNSLIILPEMFSTGFMTDPAVLPVDSPDLEQNDRSFLAELAVSLKCHILGGITKNFPPSEPTIKAENRAVLYSPAGKEIFSYAKMHLFSPGGESKYFTAGDAPGLIELDGLTVQVSICYDLRFPELYRSVDTWGAELILVSAAWPLVRRAHWQTLLKARAVENQAWVIGVNQTGKCGDGECAGSSLVCTPEGETVLEAGSEEGIFAVTVDGERCRSYRSSFNTVSDRRKIER